MNSFFKIVLVVFCSVFIGACASDNNPHQIRLNAGEKWAVNAEMKPHILQGNEILQKYLNSNSQEYHALAEQLEAQNMRLIESCTMKGESHDELHKWLLPHMKLIKDLGAATNLTDAKNIIPQLEASFKTYQEFFR